METGATFEYKNEDVVIHYRKSFRRRISLNCHNYSTVLIMLVTKSKINISSSGASGHTIKGNCWQLLQLSGNGPLLITSSSPAELLLVGMSNPFAKKLIPKENTLTGKFRKDMKDDVFSVFPETELSIPPVLRGLIHDLYNKKFTLPQLASLYYSAKTTELVSMLMEQALLHNEMSGLPSEKELVLADKAKEIMELSVGGKFSVQTVVEQTGTNETTLKYAFKKVYGASMYQYFLQLRMHYANQLLKEGKSVTEVSDLVGYRNLSHFSYAYRCTHGRSPKAMHSGV